MTFYFGTLANYVGALHTRTNGFFDFFSSYFEIFCSLYMFVLYFKIFAHYICFNPIWELLSILLMLSG